MNKISSTETGRFLETIESHKGIIYKVANSYCRDIADREDLIQEIVFQLWRSREKYNDRYAMSTWIYRIALNVSISALRKSSRKKKTFPVSSQPIEWAAEEQSPEDEDLRQLQQFIGQLKELDRALILLYLDEKSHKEMSEILGLSTTNIATKLNRIKKKLGQMFEQEKNYE